MSNDIALVDGTDNFGAFAKIASQESRSGQMLKMGKDGTWTAGASDEAMTGERLLADVIHLVVGWRKWVDNKVVDTDMGFVAEGFTPKSREELDDNDTELWIFNKSGQRQDPWQFGYTLRLTSSDGQSYIYNATSYGAKGATGDLCSAFARKRVNPYVTLGSSSYRHKAFGKTYNPMLNIVGWESDEMALPAQKKPAVLAFDADDMDVPF